jgi:hypothetical protein
MFLFMAHLVHLQICDRVPDYKLYPEGDVRIKSWLTEEQFLAGLAISQVWGLGLRV